ncbi:MAG: PepSY domain-containing protein [Proteobacteria bacterium]|nr:PepSY domain-containing protein [Pseudomonadota bacterium]MBW3617149.1 PepSY domain-containing protein [Pseudomonadota bacterium]
MRRLAVIIALLTALPASASAFPSLFPVQLGQPSSLGAGYRAQQDEARDAVRRGRQVPLGRVLDQLRRRTPGRHLDVGQELQGDRVVYRVRWAASDGRRIDYIVDAQTGAVIRADGE